MLYNREIKTGKTVTLYKLNFILFFHEKPGKQKGKVGTNFNLLSQSRNMTGQFMKTYLHWLVNFSQPGKFKNI